MKDITNIGLNYIQLPSDITIEIISLLDDVKDLTNCMLISREVRDMIFKTPKIMKRINFKIDSDFPDAYNFVCERGNFIRNLEFVNKISIFEVVKAFLCQMPNLEKLTITENIDIQFKVQNEEVLRKSLENQSKKLENVNKLKELSLDFYDCGDTEAITNFICQQHTLQTLSVEYPYFPSRDISGEVNFKLKSLTIFVNHPHMLPFIDSQAEHLESFTYRDLPTLKLCELIFAKMKKLEKIVLETDDDCYIYDGGNPHWKLESLKYFEDESESSVVKNLSYKFPNLEHLSSIHFAPGFETYSNLTTLDVFQFRCERFKDAKFPKLKNLNSDLIVGPLANQYRYWENFIKNNPNIENIQISGILHREKSVFRFIVKQIINLNNLRSFKICRSYTANYESLSEEEEFNTRKEIYKIWIDTDNKTVKTSYFIATNDESKKIYNFLKENFKEFKFNYFDIKADAKDVSSYNN